MTYDSQAKAFNFINRGETNVYLWGDRVGDGVKSIDRPVTVTPRGGSYHIFAEDLINELNSKLATNTEAKIKFDVYISTEDKQKHILNYMLWIRKKDGVLSIETQNTGTTDENFTQR